MTLEQMQNRYRWIRQTWKTQDVDTKRQMVEQLQLIHRSLLSGQRGFMTHIHDLEQEIRKDLDS